MKTLHTSTVALVATALLLTGCRSMLFRKAVSVPPAVQAQLDKEYPAWVLHQVEPETLKILKSKSVSGSPAIVSGDFNGDGLEDVALLINATSRSLLIIANRVAGSENYNLLRLYEDGADYIFVLRKGEAGYDHNTKKNFTFPHDSVEVNWLGKAARAYVFRDGKYCMVQTFDARIIRAPPAVQPTPTRGE